MSAHDEAVEAAARQDLGGNPPLLLIADVDIKVRAYLAHMAAAGWKLTPREATEGMAVGAIDRSTADAIGRGLYHSVWSAMHDAAPSPEEAP